MAGDEGTMWISASFLKYVRISVYSGFLIISLSVYGCGGGSGSRGTAVTQTPQSTASPSELEEVQKAIQDAGAEWEAEENPISQLPTEEFDSLLGAIIEEGPVERTAPRNALADTQLPSSLDWRNKDGANWMTPIKNQSQCGTCMAFSTIGILEAKIKIVNNNPTMKPDLSETDLYSCNGRDCGVNHGLNPIAAVSLLQQVGVVDEACLPYSLRRNVSNTYELVKTCSDKCSDWSSRVTKIKSYERVAANQNAIKNQLLQGPVIAIMKVYRDFSYYRSGIYRYVSGAFRGYHGVGIVGYNDNGGYWIVRNSWGTTWGEAGYFKIRYGDLDIDNYVIAIKYESNSAGVVATASPTTVTLTNNKAQSTLTCNANGTVTTLEGRCHTTSNWELISSGNTLTCTYTNTGQFTPACRANGTVTDNVDTPVTVTAVNQPPSASFAANPISGSAPLSVQFTGACTDTDGTCVSYNWSFGDGNVSAIKNPTHAFTSPGTYPVVLTVTDDKGSTDTESRTITVAAAANHPPTVNITTNTSNGTAPLTVNFTGNCTDTDGSCTSYTWNFGDGTPTINQANPSHTFSNAGTYNITLTVADDDGATAQAAYTITATTAVNQAPVATVSASPANGTTPLTVAFTGNCTDADGICVSFSWNFGDGSPLDNQTNPSHTYTSAGTHTATLTVTDDGGATSLSQIVITVSAAGGGWVEISPGSATGYGISSSSGNAYLSSMAFNSVGDLVVSWNQAVNTTRQIYMKKWDGVTWGDIGIGSSSGYGLSNSSYQAFVKNIVADTQGNLFMVWTNSTGGATKLYIKKWNGSAWVEVGAGSASGNGIISLGGTISQLALVLDATENPVVLWTESISSNGHYDLFAKRWDGVNWVEFGSGAASGGGISGTSSVNEIVATIDSSGYPIAIWQNLYNGYYYIYVKRWNGNSWVEMGAGSASGTGITPGIWKSERISVTSDASDSPVIAWVTPVSGSGETYAKQWNGISWVEIGTGSATGGGISNNPANSIGVSVAKDTSGNPFVAWTEISGSDYTVHVKHWDGASWNPVGTNLASSTGVTRNVIFSPGIVRDTSGNPIVGWNAYYNGTEVCYIKKYLP